MRRLIILGVALLALSFRANAAEPHPLTNVIYDVQADTNISVQELMKRLTASPIILLGERHGRRAHQQREAFLISALADRNRYPALAFEMLTPSQSEAVATFRQQSPESAGGLGSYLKWHSSNWPSWSFYAPLFQVAFTAKLPVVGAELDQSSQQRAAHTARMPRDIARSWTKTLDRAHCGLSDRKRLKSLVRQQWQRDLNMARIVKTHANNKEGVLLVAGSAHVRRDRSIPRHIDQDVVSVALMEVRTATKPHHYLPGGRTNTYDYIWFTPSETKQSTCERLRAKGLIE